MKNSWSASESIGEINATSAKSTEPAKQHSLHTGACAAARAGDSRRTCRHRLR